jgi:protein SCO1
MRTRFHAIGLALLATALAAGLILAVTIGGSSGHPPSSSSSSTASGATASSGFDGAPFPAGISAPGFTLSDQYGGRVSLSDYRGRVVVLSFLYSTCGDTCIVIAQQIRGALNELDDEHAREPAVLIVSADLRADTPAHIARFLAEVSLTGRVEYLTGSLSQLRSVWRAYGIKPASDGTRVFDDYAPVLLIDRSGEKRVLFESEELTPEALSHDIGKLEGDPTGPGRRSQRPLIP